MRPASMRTASRKVGSVDNNPRPSVSRPTIKYGSCETEVLRRSWTVAPRSPYRKTDVLKPGEKWFDAPTTEKQWESYVVEPDGCRIPVGAKIARELIDEGAVQAAFVELWGGCVLVDHTLTCIQASGQILDTLELIRRHNSGKLAGFPDVIGIFADGRIALREAKCLASKDRLNTPQHQLSDLMRTLLGDKLDLKVVEWGEMIEDAGVPTSAPLVAVNSIENSSKPTSWHVSVAAESLVASLLARVGLDVSVQYGADQPEYDLLIARGDDLAKVSVKGSQDGSWGLTQKYLKSADYQAAISAWEAAHARKTIFALVQFKGVALDQMPRVYFATTGEIATRLRATAKGRGDTILYESKVWTPKAHASATIDAIPESWKFSEDRINGLISSVCASHPQSTI
jgi:hypothetical protein